jgi:hypothetical protein
MSSSNESTPKGALSPIRRKPTKYKTPQRKGNYAIRESPDFGAVSEKSGESAESGTGPRRTRKNIKLSKRLVTEPRTWNEKSKITKGQMLNNLRNIGVGPSEES